MSLINRFLSNPMINERKQKKIAKKQKKLEKFIKKQSSMRPVQVKKSVDVQISRKNDFVKTSEGEMKDLSSIPDIYDPILVEDGWSSWWNRNGFFKPENIKKYRTNTKNTYVMLLPPPNVTGKLHIGHAMMVAIEDAIVRYKRMCGHEVLFLPGCDHAGIATQVVVEKKLYNEKKQSRHDIGRELFVNMVWDWKNEYGNAIMNQIIRMGTSVDLDRHVFTLDEKVSMGVTEAFVRLHEKKLIYREAKLINWCSKLATAISDLEVHHKTVSPFSKIDVDGKKYTFGVLYTIKYPLSNKDTDIIDEFIEITTTRPETILGDTGICIHPEDQRAKYLTTKVAVNPITNKKIPIIVDEHADMSFGTGVLKITPAHDFNDYELAKKHNLEIVSIFNENNEITVKGDFLKMKRFYARARIIEFLKKKKLFVSEIGYEQTLPVCSRSGDIIEPMLKEQWWLDCKEMAKKAIRAVENKQITILPAVAVKNWNHWMLNIRDWCLSRQLWWGHRIPAYHVIKDNKHVGWIVERDSDKAMKKAAKTYNLDSGQFYLEQDEDVLDTWFSSGLWPFVVFGWPNLTDDYQKFFPNSILETGSDILFFWVARMVMLSIELTGKVPFATVLLHGIVRDAKGRKMSKSLGNVIDPIFVIEGAELASLEKSITSSNLNLKEIKMALDEQRKTYPTGIPQCGADALRFTLCSYTSGMKDINLDILRADGYRKFCNKIWNAFKFIIKMVESSKITHDSIVDFKNRYFSDQECTYHDMLSPNKEHKNAVQEINRHSSVKNMSLQTNVIEKKVSEIDISANASNVSPEKCIIEWIYTKRNELVKEYCDSMETFNFMCATQAVHQFTLYYFCDVFIEMVKWSKSSDYVSALVLIFSDIIAMLHPFMPFITEELFQRLKQLKLQQLPISISIAEIPSCVNVACSEHFPKILNICRSIRSITDSNGIRNARLKIDSVMAVCFSAEIKALCKNIKTVELATKIEGEYIDSVENIKFSITPEQKHETPQSNSSSDVSY